MIEYYIITSRFTGSTNTCNRTDYTLSYYTYSNDITKSALLSYNFQVKSEDDFIQIAIF